MGREREPRRRERRVDVGYEAGEAEDSVVEGRVDVWRLHRVHEDPRNVRPEGHVDEDENLIETPIGEWDVSAAPDEFYISPACGAAAVTHMDANAKRMHHRFHWRAPTGLGRVTFRLLLKWGETNGGNFYWPMTEGDLTLDEGAIVPDANASASWVSAPANVTCDEACAARAGACDGAALAAAAAASTDAFVEHMAPSRVCRLPVLEGCGCATDATRARARRG